MPLNDLGFLGTEIERHRRDIVKHHEPAFTLARDVNAFWQRTKFRLQIHNRDGQEVLGASLLIKMLNDFQAAVLVLERGLVPQGQVLLRCTLEALFILRRVTDDHDFVVTWAKSDERDRLRMLTAVRDDAAGLPASIDPGELAERIERMEARVTEVGAKAVRVADVMAAGDPGWLASLYMLWSFPVHSAPRSLKRVRRQGTRPQHRRLPLGSVGAEPR